MNNAADKRYPKTKIQQLLIVVILRTTTVVQVVQYNRVLVRVVVLHVTANMFVIKHIKNNDTCTRTRTLVLVVHNKKKDTK